MDAEMIITILCSVMASSGFWAIIMKLTDRKSAQSLALQCLLRDRILQGCKFYIKQGWADAAARTNMAKMYDAYSKLNGNDVAHDAYGRFRSLPTEAPEEQ